MTVNEWESLINRIARTYNPGGERKDPDPDQLIADASWIWQDDLITFNLDNPPFAEYNTDQSLADMNSDPLPWE